MDDNSAEVRGLSRLSCLHEGVRSVHPSSNGGEIEILDLENRFLGLFQACHSAKYHEILPTKQ